MTITTGNPNNNLFIVRSYVLDVFFVRDAIEGNMPNRNVKTLAVGSGFSSVTCNRDHPRKGLRQWYDLHVLCGEHDPCLVDMPEGKGFWDVVIPERRL